MTTLRNLLIALVLLWTVSAEAAVATLYLDTGGCESNSATLCSGTTDSASASAKGTGSTITCSATSGVGALVPGCLITGTQGAAGQLGAIAVDGSQALFVNCATNSNQKIFFITAVDDATGAISTISTVGTPITPTGCTAATAAWGIGGRLSSNALVPANFEAALRPGDTIQFNQTPATRTAAYNTCRTPGTIGGGFITVQGKTGVRPVLQITSGAGVPAINCGQGFWRFINLELKTVNTSLAALNIGSGVANVASNVLISACGSGGIGITVNGAGTRIVSSEIHGCGIGISTSVLSPVVFSGNYIHDNSSDGINISSATPIVTITDNLIVSNAGRGVFFSGATTSASTQVSLIESNTIALNTLAGLEVTDADTILNLRNNIIMNANSANIVLWSAGSAELGSSHAYNLFYSSSTGTLSGLTVNSTELTSDPLFTNSGAADFTLQTGSPARNSGFPGQLLGSGLGYRSLGALQPQGSSGQGFVIGD